MELTVTAHAVLSFAERVLCMDIAVARRACAAELRSEPGDAALLSWLQERGCIDKTGVRLEIFARITCGHRISSKVDGGRLIDVYALADCDCRAVVEVATGNVVPVSPAKTSVRAGLADGGYSRRAA